MFACIHVISEGEPELSRKLQRCAESFAPWVEFAAEGDVVFNIDGLELLYGETAEVGEKIAAAVEAEGLKANVAVAVNAEAALLAAHSLPGLSVIAPEHTSEVLGRFGVETLAPAADLLEVLHSWGIRTLGELASLPGDGLIARFGMVARRLQLMARGLVRRPLDYRPSPNEYLRQVQFEYPVRLVEGLLFSLGASLRDLCQELQHDGLAAGRVRLELRLSSPAEFHELKLRLPFPSTDSRHLLRVLQFELEKNPPPKGVIAFTLDLSPERPRAIQRGLFIPQSPQPDKLELTIGKLRVLAGDQNVGIAKLCNSHRPRAFELQPHLLPVQNEAIGNRITEERMVVGLRLYTPARRAKIRMAGARPAWIESETIKGRIEECAGPWRSSGHWWDEWNWQREEWDISLSHGAAYLIFRCPRGWFIEAEYD